VIVILGGSFVGLYGVTNVLHIVAFEARHPAGVIAANLSEAIAPVAIGFFIALILYVAIACLESLVERRAAR
jgi:biopolymer transport protein ExbB/TolQ